MRTSSSRPRSSRAAAACTHAVEELLARCCPPVPAHRGPRSGHRPGLAPPFGAPPGRAIGAGRDRLRGQPKVFENPPRGRSARDRAHQPEEAATPGAGEHIRRMVRRRSVGPREARRVGHEQPTEETIEMTDRDPEVRDLDGAVRGERGTRARSHRCGGWSRWHRRLLPRVRAGRGRWRGLVLRRRFRARLGQCRATVTDHPPGPLAPVKEGQVPRTVRLQADLLERSRQRPDRRRAGCWQTVKGAATIARWSAPSRARNGSAAPVFRRRCATPFSFVTPSLACTVGRRETWSSA